MAGELHGRLAAAGLLPPVRLTLAVARNCNLRCRHCYVQSSEGGSPEPQGDAIRRVLNEFADLGGRAVVLTGGEPLTRPDWLDLVAFACRENRFEEVRLQTNATLVDRGAAEALASLGCSRLLVQVSMEGGAAETHDRIRGPGVFARRAASTRWPRWASPPAWRWPSPRCGTTSRNSRNCWSGSKA